MSTGGIIAIILCAIVVCVIVGVVIYLLTKKNKTEDEDKDKKDTKASSSTKQPAKTTSEANQQQKEETIEKYPQVFLAVFTGENEPVQFLNNELKLTDSFTNAGIFGLNKDKLMSNRAYFGPSGMTVKEEEAISISDPSGEAEYDLTALNMAVSTIIGTECEVGILMLVHTAIGKKNNDAGLKNILETTIILNAPYIKGETINPEPNGFKQATFETTLDLNKYLKDEVYQRILCRSTEPTSDGVYKTGYKYMYEDPTGTVHISDPDIGNCSIVKYYPVVRFLNGKVIGEPSSEFIDPLSLNLEQIPIENDVYTVPVVNSFFYSEDDEVVYSSEYSEFSPIIDDYLDANYFSSEPGVPFRYVFEETGQTYKILPAYDVLYRIAPDGAVYVPVMWDNGMIEDVEYNKSRVDNNNIITNGLTLPVAFEITGNYKLKGATVVGDTILSKNPTMGFEDDKYAEDAEEEEPVVLNRYIETGPDGVTIITEETEENLIITKEKDGEILEVMVTLKPTPGSSSEPPETAEMIEPPVKMETDSLN